MEKVSQMRSMEWSLKEFRMVKSEILRLTGYVVGRENNRIALKIL